MAARSALAVVALAVALSCVGSAAAQAASYPSFTAALAANKDFSRINEVVAALGLGTAFSNPKLAVTIFTPNNVGFTAAEKRTGISVAALQKSKALMQQIVYYHVAKEVVRAPLPQGKVMKTFVTGKDLTGAGMVVKGAASQANIVAPNIVCGAGIAHGIDNVLTFIKVDAGALGA